MAKVIFGNHSAVRVQRTEMENIRRHFYSEKNNLKNILCNQILTHIFV